MKYLLIAIFFLFSINLFAQTVSKEAFINATQQHVVRSSSEPYILVNNCVPVLFRQLFSYELKALKKELNGKMDEKYLTELLDKAIKDTLPLTWNAKLLTNAKVVPEKAAKKTGKTTYFFSRPVFTSNNLYALVRLEYRCASMCAKSCNYIFKKSGTSWIKIHEFGCWGR